MVAGAVALGIGLAGCGGGGDEEPGLRGPTTTGVASDADRSRALIAAVCQSVTRRVPPVPDTGAPARDRRAYLEAVEGAMRTLAPDLERLARRDPDRRLALTELARRSRAVATTARRTADGRVSAGEENDLATNLAKLNVLATRERLPQCGV